jgi:hypothetical protein
MRKSLARDAAYAQDTRMRADEPSLKKAAEPSYAQRVREKQASRDADYARVRANPGAVKDLRSENALIPPAHCRGPIDWSVGKLRL